MGMSAIDFQRMSSEYLCRKIADDIGQVHQVLYRFTKAGQSLGTSGRCGIFVAAEIKKIVVSNVHEVARRMIAFKHEQKLSHGDLVSSIEPVLSEHVFKMTETLRPLFTKGTDGLLEGVREATPEALMAIVRQTLKDAEHDYVAGTRIVLAGNSPSIDAGFAVTVASGGQANVAYQSPGAQQSTQMTVTHDAAREQISSLIAAIEGLLNKKELNQAFLEELRADIKTLRLQNKRPAAPTGLLREILQSVRNTLVGLPGHVGQKILDANLEPLLKFFG